MGTVYSHITSVERNVIQSHLNRNQSQSAIAVALGRSKSTISREIQRNKLAAAPEFGHAGYDACSAGTAAHARRRRGLVRLASGTALREHVFAQIRLGWSPQQISGRLKQMKDGHSVAHETIYRAIYVLPRGELRKEIIEFLRHGHSLRRPRNAGKDRRGTMPGMISIHERPQTVLTRQTAGDWEGDLIKGPGNRTAVGTFVERKTRFLILAKMKDATANSALASFSKLLSRVPAALLTSLTYDQGKEMARHEELAKILKTKVYFCDPHSPWQRPTNENTNGLVRQYLPKKMDLAIYSQKDLDKIAESLNDRPRASLAYRTPKEAYEDEIRKQSVALHS